MRVERTNLFADLDEMTTLVQWIKDEVGTSLSNGSTEVQKTYGDRVRAVKRKIQKPIADG